MIGLHRARGGTSAIREHFALLTLLATYAGCAFALPTLTDAAVSDDWMYAWHVKTLLESHEFSVHELSTSNAIFQTLSGALFAAIFGMSFGALRMSTVIFVALSALAMYGVCREVGGERSMRALATAAYLFNPLAFVLSYTFMTDSHFTALLVTSVYFYVRGVCADRGARATIAGAVFAALAFLIRPQALLIPAAVATYLLIRRRLGFDGGSVRLLARIAVVPILTALLYQGWLRLMHGVPRMQEAVWSMVLGIDIARLWELVSRVAWAEAMYAGLMALPLVAAGLTRVGVLVQLTPVAARVLVGSWFGVLLIGASRLYAGEARLMPHTPQFFGAWGLGPDDLLGGRPIIFPTIALAVLTLVAAAGSAFLLLALSARVAEARRLASPGDRADERAPVARHAEAATLCATVLLCQGAGAIVTSVHVPSEWISYDRYLLPMLPFTLALGVWALRGLRPAVTAGWIVVAALAVFSIASTRDFLVVQGETWKLARWAVESGVPIERLDAGAAWGGWSFAGHPGATKGPVRSPDGHPWWINFWARPIDSSYVIATRPLAGHAVVRQVAYASILAAGPTHLYLLRRHGVDGPL